MFLSSGEKLGNDHYEIWPESSILYIWKEIDCILKHQENYFFVSKIYEQFVFKNNHCPCFQIYIHVKFFILKNRIFSHKPCETVLLGPGN